MVTLHRRLMPQWLSLIATGQLLSRLSFFSLVVSLILLVGILGYFSASYLQISTYLASL